MTVTNSVHATNGYARKAPREVIAGRLPPFDLECEAAVLSASMLDAKALARAVAVIEARDFYSDANRYIFQACCALAAAASPVDLVTVCSWLRDREKLGEVGGMTYVAQIADSTPAVQNVEAHAKIVREKSQARALIAKCQKIAAEAYGDLGDHAEFMSGAERAIAEVTRVRAAEAGHYGAADIFNPPPAPAPLVARLDIGVGAVTLVAGFGYSRKTLAGQSLALAVALGRRVWGDFAAKDGAVLHLDFEQGPHLTLARYKRLARSLAAEHRDLDGRIEVLSPPPFSLETAGVEETLVKLCTGRVLLLVDSLRAGAPTIEENASEVRGVLDMLGRVSDRTGCAVVVVHHARKPSANDRGGAKMALRGSGALFDAAASVLIFSAEKGEPTLVQHEKARTSGILHEDFYIESVDEEIDGDARAGLRVVVKTKQQVDAPKAPSNKFVELKAEVLRLVAKETSLTSKNAICSRLSGAAKGIKLEAIRELVDEQKLTQIGGCFRVV